jgi:hypothetical protein
MCPQADRQLQRAAIAQAQTDARLKTAPMTTALDRLKLAINPFGADKGTSVEPSIAPSSAAASDRLERIKAQLQEAAVTCQDKFAHQDRKSCGCSAAPLASLRRAAAKASSEANYKYINFLLRLALFYNSLCVLFLRLQIGAFADGVDTDEFGARRLDQSAAGGAGVPRDGLARHAHAGRGKELILRVARGERPRASVDCFDGRRGRRRQATAFDPYADPGGSGSDGEGSEGGSEGGRSDGGASVDLNVFGGRQPAPQKSATEPTQSGGGGGHDTQSSGVGATARREQSRDRAGGAGWSSDRSSEVEGAAARTAAAMADALAAHPVPAPVIFRGPMTVRVARALACFLARARSLRFRSIFLAAFTNR